MAEVESNWAKAWPVPGVVLRWARVCAVASEVARRDSRLSAEEQKRLAERYAARAVRLLESGRAKGELRTADEMEDLAKSPDLDPLRSRADFRKLMNQ
jgi:hypothetical protein